MENCKFCGRKINDSMEVCPGCGALVDIALSPTPPPTDTSERVIVTSSTVSSTNSSSTKASTNTLEIIFGYIWRIVLGGFSVFLFAYMCQDYPFPTFMDFLFDTVFFIISVLPFVFSAVKKVFQHEHFKNDVALPILGLLLVLLLRLAEACDIITTLIMAGWFVGILVFRGLRKKRQ